ncbi:Dynein heavy chain [Fasciolopsis buskii]|uniref:Dynein heavy chain n=1 Tax=Fasciolopsis buskii TaxID=27845 RepID=A0A8E0VGT2_9TREM|nr:Dynein heavy chain [Fasciolopsis buski]
MITNQIIATCKRYLTNNHTQSIWEQDSQLIIERMQECIELNLAYQEAYRSTRDEMIENGSQRAFNFSEVQIFGNMNLFTQRLEYLIRVLRTLMQYATLREFVLEGKEPIIVKLDRLHSIITSKKYDYLDQRNQQFEADYEDFKARIAELHVPFYSKLYASCLDCLFLLKANLLTVISAYFCKPCDLIAQINLQQRLETLMIPDLEHKERYKAICRRLKEELAMTARLMKSGMADPPLDRNMPPFAEPFGRPYVNMDPEVLGLLREIECLDKLQCPIPRIAEEFWMKASTLKENYELLKVCTVAEFCS